MFVTLRKLVKREVCRPKGVGREGKALWRGAPNNPHHHTCPCQHSPGRAEEEDPEHRRKAAQTQQPQKTKKKILQPPQKEKGRAVTFSGLQGQTRDHIRAPNGVGLNLHTGKSSLRIRTSPSPSPNQQQNLPVPPILFPLLLPDPPDPPNRAIVSSRHTKEMDGDPKTEE